MGGPPAWRMGDGLTTLRHKKKRLVTKGYTGPHVSTFEQGNEILGSITGGEFIALLSGC